jgi:hypothetical protein
MNNNGFEIDVLDGQAWIIKTINGVEYSATLATAEEFGLNATDMDECLPVPKEVINDAYAVENEWHTT